MTDVSRSRPTDPAVEAAARGRVVNKRDRRAKVKRKTRDRPQARAPSASLGAYSIKQFCDAHGGISEAFFHALVAKGKGPKLMKIGARTLISVDAAAAWRAQREAATA